MPDQLSPFWSVLIALIGALTPLVVIVTAILQTWHQSQKTDHLARKVEEKAEEVKGQLDIRQVEESIARDNLLKSTNAVVANSKASLSVNNSNSDKLDKMYDSLNGDGVTGMLKASAKWQSDHEKKDDKQHAETKQMVEDRSAELSKKIDNVAEAVRNSISSTR